MDTVKLEIYLKSGHTVNIECEDYKFDYEPRTLEYIGYTFKKFKNVKTFNVVPSQIAGYIVKN